MIVDKQVFTDMINAPIRSFTGRVEVYNGSTLASVCGCHDNLKSFTVERVGEQGKFFGFGICQKLSVNLLDRERALNITTDNFLEVEFGVENNYVYPCPKFYVTEVNRDENTNELTITAYDALNMAATYTVADLDLPLKYTLKDFAMACATLLGVPLSADALNSFTSIYEGDANFSGSESVREALNAIAEATQTIYFINRNWELTFMRLDKDAAPALTISKEAYFTLESKAERRLSAIVSATELGDNVGAELDENGVTQYVRDNPFWELRDDIGNLVEDAIANVGGLTINPFNCSWRGNFLLEIGDKIELITKDDGAITGYVLDDSFSFNGSLSGKTQWDYSENTNDSAANPSSLGEVIKQTYARVDKVNKQIDLVASEVDANTNAIGALQVNTDSVIASVSKIESVTNQAIDDVNNNISTLTSKVEAQITSEDIVITVQAELANGVEKVNTGKGFTFDDDGLTIEDLNPNSNKNIKTTVSNNGMAVFADDEEVLTANDDGVKAKDLHAVTFLIIGKNSRLEDYGSNRTGCFWIGG